MKASDIKPGDVLDGWTVTEAKFAAPVTIDLEAKTWTNELDAVVLLTLERNVLEHVGRTGPNERATDLIMAGIDVETRRTWYRADEEVKVSRESR